jgi:hypothetical protein
MEHGKRSQRSTRRLEADLKSRTESPQSCVRLFQEALGGAGREGWPLPCEMLGWRAEARGHVAAPMRTNLF